MPTKHADTHASAAKPEKTNNSKKEEKKETAAEYQERIEKLVKSVKDAFTSNEFDVPGDIDIQVRNMASLTPHPTFPPGQ